MTKTHLLLLSDQARSDLIDIWQYIALDSIAAADKFIDLIHEKCEGLCTCPEMGRRRDELIPGLRSFPVKKYIVYSSCPFLLFLVNNSNWTGIWLNFKECLTPGPVGLRVAETAEEKKADRRKKISLSTEPVFWDTLLSFGAKNPVHCSNSEQ